MFRNYRNYRVPVRRTFIGVAGLALGVCVSIFLILQYGQGFDRGHRGSRIYRVNSYEQFLRQEPGKVVPAVLGAVAWHNKEGGVETPPFNV
jgi:hypothetical protein